jgi:hypothetical protein
MKQVKRFAKGGTTPDELIEKMQRGLASRAYDEAMPEADTTFGKLPSTQKEMPSKYSSVRSNDFEKNVQQEKRDAVKQGLSGAGKMAKQAGLAAIPGGVGALTSDVYEGIRGGKMAKDAVKKYMSASEKENAADRELKSQTRRETRGKEYKKGGSVNSAAKRADGCITKGHTKGTMVKMAMGGKAC